MATPLRGVNLGGWLVLEQWITPSLFKGTRAKDEYTFCKHAGKTELARLKKFRDTFITKQDFEWLAAHDTQAVRLPVGYWMFGEAAPYQPTVHYVDKVFEWAKATGIQVLVDLHGAPGSQNGLDHSGRIGATDWHQQPEAMQSTLHVIRRIAERYSTHPALLGISLLNEPHPTIPKHALLEYYAAAYQDIRRICGNKPWVVFSDGYIPPRWRKQLPLFTFPGMYIDTHQYRVFTPLDRLLPPFVTLLRTHWWLPRIIKLLKRDHPVVVGEWSLALGSLWQRKHSTARREQVSHAYAKAQLRAYQSADAWFFWTYKTEQANAWSFRNCIEKHLFD